MLKEDDLLLKVKQFLKDHSESGNEKWAKLSIKEVQNIWQVPQYLAKHVVSRMQIEPDIRYRVLPARSRYSPRAFAIGTPEEKLNDIKNGEHQIDVPVDIEKTLVKRLQKYATIETLVLFYKLLIICEKLILKNIDQQWGAIDLNVLARTLGVDVFEINNLINLLQEENILKKSPVSDTWLLTITEEDARNADREITKIISSGNKEIIGSIDQNVLIGQSNTPNIDSPELQKLGTDLQQLMAANSRISGYIMNLLKSFDALKIKETVYRKEKIAFHRLNDAYNKSVAENEELKSRLDDLQLKLQTLDKAFDKRASQAEEELNTMVSELSSMIEEYSKLPTYKKNNDAVNSSFKSNMLKTVISCSDKAIKNLRTKE